MQKLRRLFQRAKLSNTDLHRLFDRLHVLFTAGLPLLQSVQFVADNDTGLISQTMSEIAGKISTGHPFSRCFAAYPWLFPAVVPGMLSVAERVGALDVALCRLASYFQRAHRLQSQLMGGLLYPAGILLAALGMVGVLVFVVFPREQQVLAEMGRPMPYLSLLAVHSVQMWVVVLCLSLVFLTLLYAWCERQAAQGNLKPRRRWDKSLLFIPILGKVIERSTASRMLGVLSNMLEVGVTLTQTEPVAAIAQNECLGDRYRAFLRDLRNGMEVEEALTLHAPFPKVAQQIFLLGYEHGKMVQSLRNAAEMLETEVENALSTFVALLEPMAMMVVGSVVGILVIATALPMLSLLQGL